MDVDIFVRPIESPTMTLNDDVVRLYYNGQWVDFRNGDIRISEDGAKEQSVKADAQGMCESCNDIIEPGPINYCFNCGRSLRTA